MNTYILIQKRQDKKKNNKIFIIGVNIDNKSMNNKIYNMHTEAMKCLCVYNITQLFYFSFHINCTDSISIIYILWISYFMRVCNSTIPLFFFASKCKNIKS